MMHKIDQEGNVSLLPDYEEMVMIENALASNYVQMRRAQAPEESINKMISLRVAINDAIVSRNVFIRKRPITGKTFESTPKRNFFQPLLDILNPPFNISDFEAATSFCGAPVFLQEMKFYVSRTNFPYKVIGKVFYDGSWSECSWDHVGKCFCPALGREAYLFDLLVPAKSQKIEIPSVPFQSVK